MNISKDKLNFVIIDIAQSNSCGLDVFVHRKSLKLINIPSQLSHDPDGYEEFYGEDLEEIDNNSDLYFKIEPPISRESFDIMRDFTEQMDEGKLRKSLFLALNNKKPFSNFKHLIDNSDVREDWFKFKDQELIKRVIIEFEREMPGYELT